MEIHRTNGNICRAQQHKKNIYLFYLSFLFAFWFILIIIGVYFNLLVFFYFICIGVY